MSSLSSKDRVSLCSFTFSDGRRCRTPRAAKHPRFCFYHAQKEARTRTAQKLGKDLAYFFSGDYLSACDLSTALARLIPAVVRGDVKPKTARTVAYLAQTLMQAIHISQHEYCEAFDTDDWRESIRNSVNSNYDYRFPPAPEPEQSALSALRTNLRSDSLPPQPQPAQLQTQAHQSASQPAETPVNCHSERSEESVFSESQAELSQVIPAPQHTSSPIPTQAPPALASAPPPTSARAPQTPAAHTAPSSTACHPERSEGSHLNHTASTAPKTHPIPAPEFARPEAPAAKPDNSPQTSPIAPQRSPNRDSYALHFDHNCRLLIDGKPF